MKSAINGSIPSISDQLKTKEMYFLLTEINDPSINQVVLIVSRIESVNEIKKLKKGIVIIAGKGSK